MFQTLANWRLLVKSPLRYKTLKNIGFFQGRWAHAVKISLLKAKLHNSGRAGILSEQLKKIKQNNRIYPTFQKSQKTHEQISRLKCVNI